MRTADAHVADVHVADVHVADVHVADVHAAARSRLVLTGVPAPAENVSTS